MAMNIGKDTKISAKIADSPMLIASKTAVLGSSSCISNVVELVYKASTSIGISP